MDKAGRTGIIYTLALAPALDLELFVYVVSDKLTCNGHCILLQLYIVARAVAVFLLFIMIY